MTELVSKSLVIRSSAFENNMAIPSKYTADGDNINPPLTIENLPNNTQSLALTIEDPDSPSGSFIHWVMWNIPPSNEIQEHSAPGVEGLNSDRKNIYTGPDPGSGTHRYIFKVYALDSKLDLPANSTKEDLEAAMQGHILARGELIGTYSRRA